MVALGSEVERAVGFANVLFSTSFFKPWKRRFLRLTVHPTLATLTMHKSPTVPSLGLITLTPYSTVRLMDHKGRTAIRIESDEAHDHPDVWYINPLSTDEITKWLDALRNAINTLQAELRRLRESPAAPPAKPLVALGPLPLPPLPSSPRGVTFSPELGNDGLSELGPPALPTPLQYPQQQQQYATMPQHQPQYTHHHPPPPLQRAATEPTNLQFPPSRTASNGGSGHLPPRGYAALAADIPLPASTTSSPAGSAVGTNFPPRRTPHHHAAGSSSSSGPAPPRFPRSTSVPRLQSESTMGLRKSTSSPPPPPLPRTAASSSTNFPPPRRAPSSRAPAPRDETDDVIDQYQYTSLPSPRDATSFRRPPYGNLVSTAPTLPSLPPRAPSPHGWIPSSSNPSSPAASTDRGSVPSPFFRVRELSHDGAGSGRPESPSSSAPPSLDRGPDAFPLRAVGPGRRPAVPVAGGMTRASPPPLRTMASTSEIGTAGTAMGRDGAPVRGRSLFPQTHDVSRAAQVRDRVNAAGSQQGGGHQAGHQASW
ncbi:hypothetical protein H9P43_002529 [Blastocladiella emersonii ATCC 22665]|nr:hypothetical protein H9P43_002529 [Blastocladiella emersonii ATCC 22665]